MYATLTRWLHQGSTSCALWCGFVLLCVAGCGDLIPPRPPIQSSRDTTANEQEPATSTTPIREPEPAEFEGEWSDWYVYRFGNRIVGTTEVRAQTVINEAILTSGISQVEYRRDERLVYRSGRVSFLRRSNVSCIESVEGGLESFRAESLTGPMSAVVSGTRGKEVMSIQRTVDGTSQSSRIAWSEGNHGLFAVEQSLRRNPLEADQTRRLQVLAPSLQAVGVIEMRCRGVSSVGMLDGAYRLMREIDVLTFQDGQQVDMLVVWTDDDGVIEKTLRPQIRLESFRTDRSTANELFSVEDYDHVDVAIDGEWSSEAEPNRVTYLVTGGRAAQEDESPVQPQMPTLANQSVDVTDSQALVTVANNEDDPSDGQSAPSISADTQSTSELDFNQPGVKRMADSVGELSEKELATELIQVVKTLLSLSTQHALQPASQTVKSRRGGQADHAVVLAAIMRARGIPARVAVGLSRIADNDKPVMRLSVWVFAFVDGMWVAIDPVTGQIDRADQLCLGVASGDESVTATYVDAFESLSDLKIAIQSIE